MNKGRVQKKKCGIFHPLGGGVRPISTLKKKKKIGSQNA